MLGLVPYRRNRSLFHFPMTFGDADRFFDEWMPSLKEEGRWMPAFDISETEEHILVKADLPGMDAKDLDISITENVLTVKGEKKEEHEEKKEHYHRMERRVGSFCRSFMLPGEVESDGVEAEYKDGVLHLTIPKSEAAKPKKIEVKPH